VYAASRLSAVVATRDSIQSRRSSFAASNLSVWRRRSRVGLGDQALHVFFEGLNVPRLCGTPFDEGHQRTGIETTKQPSKTAVILNSSSKVTIASTEPSKSTVMRRKQAGGARRSFSKDLQEGGGTSGSDAVQAESGFRPGKPVFRIELIEIRLPKPSPAASRAGDQPRFFQGSSRGHLVYASERPEHIERNTIAQARTEVQ